MVQFQIVTDVIEEVARERVGNVLNDKWTLERLLGVGGTAAVYAGCHRNGARAAVKVLHPHLSRHTEVRERFQREGYAANKVAHPGVVKVLDDDVIADGPEKGTAYLIMELLHGESLQDRIERGLPVGEREFLELACDVLEVLQAAHDQGVVHRDLKPENLFLARDGASESVRVKVLDFGLARLLSGQSLTATGLALGTPSFMSPEQAAGRVSEVDGRTDLFALAATGFRVCTGRRIQEAEDPVELVLKMAKVPAPRIRYVAPEVSVPFARVIDRALEFHRDDRYESAAAMRADVQRAIAELDAGALEAPTPPPDPPARRHRRAAPTLPRADRRAPPPQAGDGDIERPTAFGLDESLRIPKHGSIWPWVVLLMFAGVAVALWRDDTHRTALWSSMRTWSSRLLTHTASNPPREAPATEPPPTSPASGPADAGAATDGGSPMAAAAPRIASTSSPRPVAAPLRNAPRPVTPSKNAPAVRHPRSSH